MTKPSDEQEAAYVEAYAQWILRVLQETGGYWNCTVSSAIYGRVDELWAESGDPGKLKWMGDDDAVGATVVDADDQSDVDNVRSEGPYR